MQLIDLIQSNSWLSIQMVLVQLHPDVEEDIEAYEKVFKLLQVMPAKTSKVTIELNLITEDCDEDGFVDVSGYYTDPAERIDPFSNSLAIEFVPWEEWLGMELDQHALATFSELEIIAHCLHEMTYGGFEQEEIQTQFEELKGIKEDYEKQSPEEREKHTGSFEESKDTFALDNHSKDSIATKEPMMFESIDRDVLIVFYKQPFIDWVNFVYSDDKMECPELLEHDQGNVYLVPEFAYPDEAAEYVKENFRHFFENELFGWCENKEDWPKDLSWEFFERCFHYSWQSVVMDTIESDIQKDVF